MLQIALEAGVDSEGCSTYVIHRQPLELFDHANLLPAVSIIGQDVHEYVANFCDVAHHLESWIGTTIPHLTMNLVHC